MQNAPLIGLIGHKHAGKSTLAHTLETQHDYRRIAFADPLKRMALVADPIVEFEGGRYGLRRLVANVGWGRAKGAPEVRRFLQHLGDAVRIEDPEFFVRSTSVRIATSLYNLPVVVDDVRFCNEAELITALGGRLVRVVRPSAEAEAALDDHRSEHDLDDYDVMLTIHNSGSLWELQQSAHAVAAAARPAR